MKNQRIELYIIKNAIHIMIKHSLILNKNLFKINKRYNSAFIPNMVSYFKDKGTCVPGAKYVLSPDEYARYKLFRTIKLGQTDELNKIITKDKYDNVSQETLISFTEELQKQPYSIPNFLLSWWGIQYGSMGIMIFVNHIKLFDASEPLDKFMKTITSDNIDQIQNVSNMSIGISGSLATIGAITIYHSINLFYQEAKSPYYNYDGILKSLKKTPLQVKVIDPITKKVNEVAKNLFEPKTDNINNPIQPSDLTDSSDPSVHSDSSGSSGSHVHSDPSGSHVHSGSSGSSVPLDLSDHPDLNFPPPRSNDAESEVDQGTKLTQDKSRV